MTCVRLIVDIWSFNENVLHAFKSWYPSSLYLYLSIFPSLPLVPSSLYLSLSIFPSFPLVPSSLYLSLSIFPSLPLVPSSHYLYLSIFPSFSISFPLYLVLSAPFIFLSIPFSLYLSFSLFHPSGQKLLYRLYLSIKYVSPFLFEAIALSFLLAWINHNGSYCSRLSCRGCLVVWRSSLFLSVSLQSLSFCLFPVLFPLYRTSF